MVIDVSVFYRLCTDTQIEVNYVSNKIMCFYSLNNVIDYEVVNNICFFYPFQVADKMLSKLEWWNTIDEPRMKNRFLVFFLFELFVKMGQICKRLSIFIFISG